MLHVYCHLYPENVYDDWARAKLILAIQLAWAHGGALAEYSNPNPAHGRVQAMKRNRGDGGG